MSNEALILAIDLGTSGLKAALITISGKIVGWESETLQTLLTPDGGVEQSPDEWWTAFQSTVIRLLKQHPDASKRVRAVCCSTQGEGTIPVDHHGRPLMNCILWMDMRGAPYLKARFKGLVNFTGVGLFNTLRWIYLTGGMPSLSGKDPAAHMLLVRERFPHVYERTYKFLNVLDYLNLKLTGRFTATYDSILTSWVTDNRNPDDIRYSPTLVKASGVESDKFPEIVPCTTLLGEIQPQVAAALGLPPSVQVVAGAIDTTAAAVGSGAVQDYLPHLYIGTSSWIAAHVPFKKTDIVSSLASVPCAVKGRYLLTALQATAGGNLTFLRDKILFHKDELFTETGQPDFFTALEQMAARTPAGSNGVLYTPWIWGERAPVEDKSLRGGFYNLSLHNTRQDLLRAVLEGIAFNTRWLLKPVAKFLERNPAFLHIAGGGAQSDAWCQIFADVLGVEIRQVADPIYANARGAAWIGAAGLGEISLNDVSELVQFKHIYTPDQKNTALYNERFAVFTQIYKQMARVYKTLNS